MVEEFVDSFNIIEKLLINMILGLSDEFEMEGEDIIVLGNETVVREININELVLLGKEFIKENRKIIFIEMESFIVMVVEFCKV